MVGWEEGSRGRVCVCVLDLTQDPQVKDSVPKIIPTPKALSQVPGCNLYF